MKRKISALLLALIAVASFSSCFSKNASADASVLAEDTLRRFISYVQDGDKENIKGLFSKNARETVENFDEPVDDLIEFFEGEVLSFGSEDLTNSNKKVHNGKRSIELKSAITVNTTKQTYYVSFNQFVINEIDQDKIGVEKFSIVKKSDWNYTYTYWGSNDDIPGIHIDTEKSVKEMIESYEQ